MSCQQFGVASKTARFVVDCLTGKSHHRCRRRRPRAVFGSSIPFLSNRWYHSHLAHLRYKQPICFPTFFFVFYHWQDATVKLWGRRDKGPRVEQDQSHPLKSWFGSVKSTRAQPERSYSWYCHATFEPKSEAIRDIQWSKYQDNSKCKKKKENYGIPTHGQSLYNRRISLILTWACCCFKKSFCSGDGQRFSHPL